MNKLELKKNHIYMIFKDSLVKLPTPVNISILWNMGSLLGLCLIIQMISGLFLSMHYNSSVEFSFSSIVHIIQDVNFGWLMRLLHMNGASMFFVCVYIHIGRGLYYGSYKMVKVWFIGVLILLLMMATAFLGYVLPWGQMSFWGATVITNLLSALPYVGQMMVEWLWGGFSVSNVTLNRFYTLHFLLPFILTIVVILHLLFLHEMGSSNPLGVKSDFYKIIFHNYFTIKDIFGFVILILVLMLIVMEVPYMMGDPENFIMANSMVTPVHIQPEWYFLFAYTILRSITNKLGGVIALLMSILILLIKVFYVNSFQSLSFYPLNQILFWFFFNLVILLTWLGSKPVEYPYVELSQLITILYFMYYFLDYVFFLMWDKIFN